AIFTTASVVTPYSRRPREISANDKGKEKMVESDTLKKKKLQEQIDVQVAREMEEEMAREDQRMNEQIARDAEKSRLHAKEELKMLIDGLDKNNEMIAKHLQEGMTLEKIREKFIPVWKQLEDFVPISSTEEGKRMKRKGLKLDEGSAKKMKTSEDVFKENLKEMMQLVHVEELVEIILFIIDSGCSKHIARNLKLLTKFMEKFLGTVKFGNDQIAPILGYGDLVQGTITIKRVYYVEGLNHNLFSISQFCDADLEVAFRKSTCYIRDLNGNNLLIGSRGTDLYFIILQETSTLNPICSMARATSSQAWLWHRRLLHLNFNTINLLSKNIIVIGLPKLKFVKDHLCSSCELGKAKRKSFHNKATPSLKRRLQLLHMDLYGPMRVESINKKKYVLVIVDDYSRYTWAHLLRFKDETPAVLIDFLRLV
nr:retrovirus-related Pol polyprotein from transposon TNT 1-94 [Tanacetum cinerariifolium]